jgi:SAM-dependent methyltransferase
MLDCGCGRAFLTLAAYHYLRERGGRSVQLVGVDADAEVIARASELRDKLGYGEVQFARSRILDYDPPQPPQALFSLHACDTATDEAIAQGVKWRADLILCAPCCQHEFHHQIARPEFRAALRHGILRERTADILTDALRAAALRVMGYRTDVMEFISSGDTPKNLMIRAERSSGAVPPRAAAEYLALRDFWGVKPCIEELLGASFKERLA